MIENLKQKFQAYQRLFKVTLAQTITQGPEHAWNERDVKNEVIN